MQNKINQKVPIAKMDELIDVIKNNSGSKLYRHTINIYGNDNSFDLLITVVSSKSTAVTDFTKLYNLVNIGQNYYPASGLYQPGNYGGIIYQISFSNPSAPTPFYYYYYTSSGVSHDGVGVYTSNITIDDNVVEC